MMAITSGVRAPRAQVMIGGQRRGRNQQPDKNGEPDKDREFPHCRPRPPSLHAISILIPEKRKAIAI
jgi:hypothetical protein